MAPKTDPRLVKLVVDQVKEVAKEIGYEPGGHGEIERLHKGLEARGISALPVALWLQGQSGPRALTRALKKWAPELLPPGTKKAAESAGFPRQPFDRPVNAVQHRIPPADWITEAQRYLGTVQTKPTLTTWKGHKKPPEQKTRILAGRLPVELIERLRKLPGTLSHHLEKAVAVYLKIMEG